MLLIRRKDESTYYEVTRGVLSTGTTIPSVPFRSESSERARLSNGGIITSVLITFTCFLSSKLTVRLSSHYSRRDEELKDSSQPRVSHKSNVERSARVKMTNGNDCLEIASPFDPWTRSNSRSAIDRDVARGCTPYHRSAERTSL